MIVSLIFCSFGWWCLFQEGGLGQKGNWEVTPSNLQPPISDVTPTQSMGECDCCTHSLLVNFFLFALLALLPPLSLAHSIRKSPSVHCQQSKVGRQSYEQGIKEMTFSAGPPTASSPFSPPLPQPPGDRRCFVVTIPFHKISQPSSTPLPISTLRSKSQITTATTPLHLFLLLFYRVLTKEPRSDRSPENLGLFWFHCL